MDIAGKLEVTIKINQLPTEVVTNKNGWKEFKIDCGGRRVSVCVRPRMWTKLEEAAASYPSWVAAISGQMGPAAGTGFVLLEPAVQVFERKLKPADDGASTPHAPHAPADGAPPAD